MQIGKAIKKCRTAAGWSQAKLASEVGVTQESVRSWEAELVEPRVGSYRALLKRLPGFSRLMNAAA